MVKHVEVYTLNNVEMWMDHIDPGPMRGRTDRTLTPMQQAYGDVIWETNRWYKDTKTTPTKP